MVGIFFIKYFTPGLLYGELWINSISPSDRNLSICGLHNLIPLKYPSPSKMLYYELNKYIRIDEFLIVSHWSLNWRKIKRKIKRKITMSYWNCLNDLGKIGADLGTEDAGHMKIEIQS